MGERRDLRESVVYDDAYYRKLRESGRRSARVVVPLVLDLVHPQSVVDVGCGVGTWLAVFSELGVDEVLGIDRDIDRELLEIPPDRFRPFDLEEPLRLDRRFDLVLSLEVAEHLSAEHASEFVESLTRLGPDVLFSAAVPFQGGRNHRNEQWPDYWAELFRDRGYVAVDCLRRKIWQDTDVDWWYAQNMLLFVEREHLDDEPLVKREYGLMGTSQLSLVHPTKYVYCIEWGRGAHESSSKR
jgi:SAM-dependent methyltransferase